MKRKSATKRTRAKTPRPKNYGKVPPDDPLRGMPWYAVVPGMEDLLMTPDVALQLSVVWACVDAITKALASCRWNVLNTTASGNLEPLPGDSLDYLLNTRANPEMPAIAWKETQLYAALTWGNGYSEIVRDNAGRVAELWPLYPDRITPRREQRAPYTPFYEYVAFSGGTYRLEASQVYHLRGPSLTGLLGDNIVARMVKSLVLAIAAERYATTYFSNNTVVGAILEYPKTLDDRSYKRLKADWDEKRSGAANAHKPLILEGGMKFSQLETDAQKSQLVEMRKFQVEEICRWFGVPLHKVQHIDRSTFNNIEHLGLEFVRDALTPWALRMQQEADWKLFPMRGPGARKVTRLDMTRLSQGDFKTRMEGYQIGRRIGVYSANDVLRMEGQNVIGPEGDVRIVETNMQPLDMVEEKAEAELKKLQASPAPSAPALPPGREQDEEPPMLNSRQLIQEAIVSLFASVIDRYAKRLSAREDDLRRHGHKEAFISANLAAERERLRPWLLEECGNALELMTKVGGRAPGEVELLLAADAVDNGEPSRQAAERLVNSHLEVLQ